MDVSGILNVKAEDMAAGRSAKITITNDKGHMSEEEIERKVKEAKEFAEEDRKAKERIDARNCLESYLYNMRNQIDHKDKLEDKLEPDEEEIKDATKEALQWMDDSQNAEKVDYDEKLKEVESVCNPIITAVSHLYGGGEAEEDFRFVAHTSFLII